MSIVIIFWYNYIYVFNFYVNDNVLICIYIIGKFKVVVLINSFLINLLDICCYEI